MNGFEHQANMALAASHAVEIWNLPDEALLESVRRIELARCRRDLAAWLRARLRQPDALQLPADLRDVAPVWPRAAAFPLVGAGGGKLGFVSASRFAAFPQRSSTRAAAEAATQGAGGRTSLELYAKQVIERLTGPFRLELPVSVWTPESADGESIGLAALAAALAGLLEETACALAAVRQLFAFTGAVHIDRGELAPVGSTSLRAKADVAARCGFRTLLVVEGQQGIPDPPPLAIRSVPRDLRMALATLMEAWQLSNPEIFQHFSEVQQIGRRLNFPLRGAEHFLPGVLASLATDQDLASLRSDLGLSAENGSPFGATAWRKLQEDYCHQDHVKQGERLVHLCHLMLERHANDVRRLPLVRLTVHLNRSKHDALTCEGAMRAIEELRNGGKQSPFSEWLQLQMIAGAVQKQHQDNFLIELLRPRDDGEPPVDMLITLAIISAERLYEVAQGSMAKLRKRLGEVMRSRPLPERCPLKERVPIMCRTDFRSLFGASDPGNWEQQLRSNQVAICRFPVTNLEYECFDPGHERGTYTHMDDCPVVDVTWFNAFNFAFWAGLCLPTRLEWLSAAVPPGWAYPYQFEDLRNNKVNYGSIENYGPRATSPVREREGSAQSHAGCVDMTGNVWEWVLDWCPPRPAENQLDDARRTLQCRMALGGGWQSSLDHLKLTSFAALPPQSRNVDVGFRCLKPCR